LEIRCRLGSRAPSSSAPRPRPRVTAGAPRCLAPGSGLGRSGHSGSGLPLAARASSSPELQVVRVQGADRSGRPVVRVVGKFFPAPVIDGGRLKRYVFHKLRTELPEGPFCILYVHTTLQSDDNNPGMTILRGIYEELPAEYKERLQIFYFQLNTRKGYVRLLHTTRCSNPHQQEAQCCQDLQHLEGCS
uniref:CRAL-TRIO domain-containing protein n=1 Tax=Aegilops tauschii subsp. strangulata TaxID=200361 RepID=A0A453PWP8_AEGTS